MPENWPTPAPAIWCRRSGRWWSISTAGRRPRLRPWGWRSAARRVLNPAHLDWRYLAALSVLVVASPGIDAERLRLLLVELVAARPKRLIVLRPGCVPVAEFVVSEARGLEVQP